MPRPMPDLLHPVHPTVEVTTTTQSDRKLLQVREFVFDQFSEAFYLATIGTTIHAPVPFAPSPEALAALDRVLGDWLKLELDRITELKALIADLKNDSN